MCSLTPMNKAEFTIIAAIIIVGSLIVFGIGIAGIVMVVAL